MQQENSPAASSVDTWWVNINPGVLGNRQLLNISEIGPVRERALIKSPIIIELQAEARSLEACIEPYLKSV
jgi:hypothetical protein